MVTKTKSRSGKRKTAAVPKAAAGKQAQPANGNGDIPSNQDVLRRLYACMLRCRMLAEQARSLSANGRPRSHYDFDIGDEAVVVGATVELESQDTMVVSARNFIAHVARGVSLQALLSRSGAENGRPADVATELSPEQTTGFDSFNLGTGLALAHRLEKKRNVVIALCSPDNCAPDRWHEALKFAGIHKLPIIYVKRASAYELAPENRAPALEGLSFMARDCGFPAIVVDGKDAVAVRRVVQESIHRARNGAGPTLIECEAHWSSAGDPLTHLEHYMKKRSVWDDDWQRDTAKRINDESQELL